MCIKHHGNFSEAVTPVINASKRFRSIEGLCYWWKSISKNQYVSGCFVNRWQYSWNRIINVIKYSLPYSLERIWRNKDNELCLYPNIPCYYRDMNKDSYPGPTYSLVFVSNFLVAICSFNKKYFWRYFQGLLLKYSRLISKDLNFMKISFQDT